MTKTPAKKAIGNRVSAKSQPSQEANAFISILENKAFKAKEKTALISRLVLDKAVSIDELMDTAKTEKDATKAILIEAMEYISKTNSEIVNDKVYEFVIQSLKDNAPRVKWESAKVIANTAHLFPALLKEAIANLLTNTEHYGNVVRWSTATALSKIILLNTPQNKSLIPAVEAIVKWEQDNAVKKIYLKALKKIGK